MLRDLLQDLRYAARSFRRSPGFAVLVVLSLGLGIGANVAIFGLIDAVVLRPLPVRAPGELVFFGESVGSRGSGPLPPIGALHVISYPLYQRLRDDPAFAGMAAEQSGQTQSVVERGGERGAPADAYGRAVTGNYFDLLGVPAFRGRTLGPADETTPGANPVVVLNHRYWQQRFGADPELVGARLAINGVSYTVVGIAPPSFAGTTMGTSIDFWVPLTMQAELMHPRVERGHHSWLDAKDQWFLVALGRLAPGVSRAAAQASANARFQQFLKEDPTLLVEGVQPGAVRLELVPGAGGASPFRKAVEYPLLLLMAGTGLLLLIVCLNLSHLLLARASRRQREMSIRAAVGASRGRLVRQLLAEGLLLASLGALAASLAAPWLTGALLSLIPESQRLGADLSMSPRALSFTGALALAVAVLMGLVPAWWGQSRLHATLSATAHAVTPGGGRRWITRVLLAGQVALSLVLLAAGGLLTASLLRLRTMDKGFDEQHVLLVELEPRLAGMSEERARALPRTILPAIRALPGVSGASLSLYQPLGGKSWARGLTVVGVTAPGQPLRTWTNAVTPGYFQTVGMRLLRGRDFTEQDGLGSPRVTIINQTLAARLFPGTDPLGQRMRDGDPQGQPADMLVVGIVSDVRSNQLRQEVRRTYYAPLAQQDVLAGSLEIRAAGAPAALTESVRKVLAEVQPDLPVLRVRTMRDQVDNALGAERVMATLAGAFGLCALLLVSLGLYGVISHWAAQRTAEIGVRMALGATGEGVRWLVLRQALVLAGAGVVLGVPAAVAATRLVRGALFGVAPLHPTSLIGSALALFAVAAVAAYLPARRASRIDPMTALRSE
jgi:predicted permease